MTKNAAESPSDEGAQVTEIFHQATLEAVKKAHAAGVSVSGRIDGKRVLVHPDQSVTVVSEEN